MRKTTGTQTLVTPRLTLRRLSVQDTDAMYYNWASAARVTHFLRWTPHEGTEKTRALLALWESEYALPDTYQWGIVRTQDNTLMGCIGVCPSEHDEQMLEPGYCIGHAFWGQGYMTEALQAVVDYMFTTVGVPELACCHAVANPASGAVMRKCGFVYIHDDTYYKFDGTQVQCACYTLTQEMYDANRRLNAPV